MGERHSEYERDEDDWYVEEPWNVARLFQHVQFHGKIHDPCCGMGTVVNEARGFRLRASGSDIVDRGFGFPARDFFEDTLKRDNIVTNPPYKIAQRVIEHALSVTRNRVAVLTQLKFLAGQRRHPLFNNDKMEGVIVFSRRPNMPPGKLLMKHGEEIRGGGSMDYCWLIWHQNNFKPTWIEWTT